MSSRFHMKVLKALLSILGSGHCSCIRGGVDAFVGDVRIKRGKEQSRNAACSLQSSKRAVCGLGKSIPGVPFLTDSLQQPLCNNLLEMTRPRIDRRAFSFDRRFS